MPFGLTNAPATFQRTLDILLSRYKWKTCLVYLDDVIIFSRDIESHLDHVEQILTVLHNAGVSLKLKKCNFFTDTVKYLGHIVRPGTLEVDLATVTALKQATYPKTQTEMRSFLGLCNVYRRFVPQYSKVSGPLNDLLRKEVPSTLPELTQEQKDAFHKLIQLVTAPPILKLPRSGLPYSIDTDASKSQIGCALFQTHPDGKRHPVGYWSRTLNQAERRYSVPEQECLAVVWSLLTLRPYLAFEKFTVNSDQSSLRWLMELSDPSGRLMRWRLRLSEFDFEINYKKGTSNSVADCLSRLNTQGGTTVPTDNDIPCFVASHEKNEEEVDFIEFDYEEEDHVLVTNSASRQEENLKTITVEELLRAQQEDDFCSAVRARLNGGERIPFALDETGVLRRHVERHPQIVVPESLQARVLYLSHHSKIAGHPGGRKLYYSLRRHFYWPSMPVACYATVRNCVSCAKNRIKLRRVSKKMKLFPASGPLEFVAIDILGELIRTPRRNRYLLVISDRYSKLVRTVPLKKISAIEVAKAFVHHWVFVYGPPALLLSDNGSQFTSKLFKEICNLLGTANVFNTTYHPQCNGQVERFNRTILASLRHYVGEHPKDWDLFSDALTFAYNTQAHKSTNLAPFELVLSRPPPPVALQGEPQLNNVQGSSQFHTKWKEWLRALMSTASTEMAKNQARYKANFDARIRRNKEAEQVGKGSYVFIRKDYSNPNEKRHKLADIVSDPFKVVDVNEDTVVVVDGADEIRISRDRVTPAPVSDVTQDELSRPDDIVSSPVRIESSPIGTSTLGASHGLADLPSLAQDNAPQRTGVVHRAWPRRRSRSRQHNYARMSSHATPDGVEDQPTEVEDSMPARNQPSELVFQPSEREQQEETEEEELPFKGAITRSRSKVLEKRQAEQRKVRFNPRLSIIPPL